MIPEVNKYYYVNITKYNTNKYNGIAHCCGLRGIDWGSDEQNYWVFNGATWGWDNFEMMVWCGEEEDVVLSEGTKEEYDRLVLLDKERVRGKQLNYIVYDDVQTFIYDCICHEENCLHIVACCEGECSACGEYVTYKKGHYKVCEKFEEWKSNQK